MTTTIKVEANHGWPVDVTPISRGGHPVAGVRRVPAGETQMFVVHSGQDLLVSEVQPSAVNRQTEGQYRVGVTFNPSKNISVDIIKAKAAELIDLLAPIASDGDHPGAHCAALAMTEIESAAMWAVKAVTKQPKEG